MLGAIIGDIIGSRFEGENRKSKDFTLFTSLCTVTDDSILSLAIAKAIISCNRDYTCFCKYKNSVLLFWDEFQFGILNEFEEKFGR